MIITKKVRITRIIAGTWKNFLFIFATCVLSYFFNEYVLKLHIVFPGIIPTILGTALAFFIGFNNNQAYDRWWESRKIWGGLVNDSRTWARQIIQFTTENDVVSKNELDELRKGAVLRHLAFLYALKEKLRSSQDNYYRKFLKETEIERIEKESNKHNAILTLQSEKLDEIYSKKLIDGFQFLELNKILIAFCDGMGKSERIKGTVFPTTYQYYSSLFTWLFIISVTIVTSNTIGPWGILFGQTIGYVFVTISAIGRALLNPFDPTPSGIALDQITRTIEINLLETIGEKEIPQPVASIDNEYIM
ncbi:bestrophin family ion channel [Flammeovirgaceae bacterium SG7u.111]|nr:bestrophin family ion channel [Flammeovirgaceae bacterium SG7u.132]WPO38036.1 bestrophin family ion channel [Flammeovirgaceae bacterium SG7u.111]